MNQFNDIEIALLPLIRNWIYLHISCDYQPKVPFFSRSASELLDGHLHLPNIFTSLQSIKKDTRSAKEPRKPVAVLKAKEIHELKDGGRYGLTIHNNSIWSKIDNRELMPYLNEDVVIQTLALDASISNPPMLQLHRDSFTRLNLYVNGIIGYQINPVAVSQFLGSCARLALSIELSNAFVNYDSVFYFNVYTVVSSAINMYCISHSKISAEIAHGSFFSIYGHEKLGPQLFIPKLTFDPYSTLRLIFSRFNAHNFIDCTDLYAKPSGSYAGKQETRQFSQKTFYLVDDKKSISLGLRAVVDSGINGVYLFDNLGSNNGLRSTMLIGYFIRLFMASSVIRKSRIFLVGHPNSGISPALEDFFMRLEASYEVISGFDAVQVQLQNYSDMPGKPCFITYTESAVWRDILLIDSYVHLHFGTTPLGKYLLQLEDNS